MYTFGKFLLFLGALWVITQFVKSFNTNDTVERKSIGGVIEIGDTTWRNK